VEVHVGEVVHKDASSVPRVVVDVVEEAALAEMEDTVSCHFGQPFFV
jgi:hypothetical protein